MTISYAVSRSRKFKSDVPSLSEWERASRGSKTSDRGHALLKYIDKKVYEHSIYYRDFVTRGEKEMERLCCLIQLWTATVMYVKAYEGNYRVFATGEKVNKLAKNPFAKGADGGTKINSPFGAQFLRIDAVSGLEAIVAKELMVLTGSPTKIQLEEAIRKAQMCQLTKHGEEVDKKGAEYLKKDERAEYRIMFGDRKAMIRDSDNPIQWTVADTTKVVSNECGNFLLDLYNGNTRNLLQIEEKLKIGVVPNYLFSTGGEDFNPYIKFLAGRVSGGHCGFVLTHGRKFYMSHEHRTGGGLSSPGFYHSAYTSGKGVLCSGSIRFDKGIPILLTNCSGHYQPSASKLEYVIRLFEMADVPTDKLSILAQVSGKPDYEFYPTASWPGRSPSSKNLGQFRMGMKGRMVGIPRGTASPHTS